MVTGNGGSVAAALAATGGAGALVALLAGCGWMTSAGRPDEPRLLFADATAELGLDEFHQVNGSLDKRYIAEASGAGVALFDYDADGDLDVFLVNGGRLNPDGSLKVSEEGPTNRLYRNDGRGRKLRDVTAEAGLLSSGAFGQGCAVADVDGDGWLDLYVTNHGPNRLYHNNGDGTFTDVAEQSGIADPGWSTGAAFLDYDRDGDLDLYVANYVDWAAHIAAHPGGTFIHWHGMAVMAGPKGLPPAAHRLYRNRGDATFEDVTREAGLDGNNRGYGFQPSTGDYDNDGDPDIFVANDSSGNFLWRNQGDGTFQDVSLDAGTKYEATGRKQACMGVAFEDYDADGWLDIFVTNFSDDNNTLYRNLGTGLFEEVTYAAGLVTDSAYRSLGWATAFFDPDSDGDFDLFIANGHVFPQAEKVGQSYKQKNLLFRNDGGHFHDVSDSAGPALELLKSSRGAAVGDLDNDGDLDILVNAVDDTPTYLRNDSPVQGHWVKVLLRGAGRNRTAIGARVTVHAAGRSQMREVRSTDFLHSHGDLRLHYGLGAAERADRIEVRWPDGSTDTVEGIPAGELAIIEQGRGIARTGPLG